MPDHVARFLSLLFLCAGILVARPVAAQCPYPADERCIAVGSSVVYGDFNEDGKVVTDGDPVVTDDLFVFDECLLGQPLCPLSGFANVTGDFNFDGSVDCIDREFLLELGRLADPVSRDGRLPKVVLAEIRTGKPASQTAPSVSESRYVEFFNLNPPSPSTDLPSGDPDFSLYADGWFYLKISRSATPTRLGTIAKAISLSGMPVCTEEPVTPGLGFSTGRSVLADQTFRQGAQPMLDAVPLEARPFVFFLPANQTLEILRNAGGRTFPTESDTNVTHLLVYRDPANALIPVPTVGQFVNLDSATCSPLTFFDGPGPPAPCPLGPAPAGSATAPWSVIVDAVTLIRSEISSPQYGCNYADTPDNANSIGPVGVDGVLAAPLHPFRCFNDNRLIKGPEAITVYPPEVDVDDSDSPFVRNAVCSPTPPPDCGEPNAGNCFKPQTGPFCADPDCCLNVCINFDAFCCETQWDAQCAQAATNLCTNCGKSTADCYIPHPTPSCEDQGCCDKVCGIRDECCIVAWDVQCADLARQLCRLCGGPNTGPCDVASDLPSCSDAQCCEAVCGLDSRCCTEAWDAQCVNLAALACTGCGGLFAGPCCIVHAEPYCEDADCCVGVCKIDATCCSVTWDLTCTQIAVLLPECADQGCVCGRPADPTRPFDCYVAHELPGCEDSFCCQTVCALDLFCCRVEWDEACVRVSLDTCSKNPGCFDPVTGLPAAGSCFAPHATPGCDRTGCCGQVCAESGFEYCCDTIWDSDCVVKAIEICDECGDPFAGSCFVAHGSPNCIDSDCCNTVCAIDNFCCQEVWDSLCVTTAEISCGPITNACGSFPPDRPNRSCWVPSYVPGCSTAGCCQLVCGIDPFCCESRWDAVCAREATFMCEAFRDFTWVTGTETCLDIHDSPGCSNPECSRAVCSVREECCTVAWDVECVLATEAVCPLPSSCPAPGDCFIAHANAGCLDGSCCNGVCAIDPSCCEDSWDGNCANTASNVCVPRPGERCPCRGSCFESREDPPSPGCDNKSCCAVVCNINPDCCLFAWDEDCVVVARTNCCGEPGCGSGCNKACLLAHEEPFCDDPYCCAAVCQADPSCCESEWDDNCVGLAVLRCASACGLAPAGDCFTIHDLPACDQGKCCAAVCQTDPYCCQAGWDGTCVGIAEDNPALCKRFECGDPAAGSPCFDHPNPASDVESCCTKVCFGPLPAGLSPDPYCCQTEWDVNCVELARRLPECGCGFTCGDPCAGDCCTQHDNPSCENEQCCDAVCQSDDYCCNVTWDAVCAQTARDICSDPGEPPNVPPGPCSVGACGDSPQSCCFAGTLPFCSDGTCCDTICKFNPFCCEVSWDGLCATAAVDVCGCPNLACGSDQAGSCFQAHAAPFCSDLECCVAVCDFNPTCCEAQWDDSCVASAEFVCVNFNKRPVPPSPDGIGGRPHRPPPGWIPPRERYEMRKRNPPAPRPRPARGPEEAEAPARSPASGASEVPSAGPKGSDMSAPAKGGKASPGKP